LGLTAVMTVLTLIVQLFTFGYFGEMIGLLSMGIEATLGLPQLISNFKTKSVKGLSIQMIGLWFLGDFAKTIYFVVEVNDFIDLGTTFSIRNVRCDSINSGYSYYLANNYIFKIVICRS